MSTSSLYTLKKLQKQQKDALKRNLLAELTLSLDGLINDDELEPWTEIVDGEVYIFESVENVTSFGTLTLTFVNKENPGLKIRLPMQLQLGK